MINTTKKFYSITDDGILMDKNFYGFLSEEITNDRKYSLYLYVETYNNKLYAKFGEAKDQSCYSRYDQTGMTQNKRMIKVWESTYSDKEIHKFLKFQSKNKHGFIWAGKKEDCPLNTSEAYIIQTDEGLENLISFIEYKIKTFSPKPINRTPYEDIQALDDEIIISNVEHYNLDLATRWGKTGTILLLMKLLHKLYNIRINIMMSYIGTVRASYLKEICEIQQNENCKFFDPDNYEEDELISEITNWLKNPKHYIMYYVALTGNTETDEDTDCSCFKRRTAALKKLKHISSMMTVEESDFGAHCTKQIVKIRSLYETMSCKKSFTITGTNAYKNEKIFISDKYIKRDYLIDVLNSKCRPDAVKLAWHVLHNAGMIDAGFKGCSLENFASMLEVINGHLREEMYFESFFTWLFKPAEATWLKSVYRKKVPINRDAATMIFTAGTNETHVALKKLLERILPTGWLVQIIDGNETTNADAEALAKECFNKRNDNHVIFIATNMANRSFSVPQIKNIILLLNDGTYSSIAQKIARGLTPYGENNVCNIVDFRMNYAVDSSNLSTYLSQLGIDGFSGKLTTKNEEDILKIIEASDKIIFDQYFVSGQTPICELNTDQLRIIMQSKDFKFTKSEMVVYKLLNRITDPGKSIDIDPKDLNAVVAKLANNNIKGDGTKKIRAKSNRRFSNENLEKTEKENLSDDRKIQHLYFLLLYPNRFNTYRFKDNILVNEFKDMSETRKLAYTEAFGINMETMSDIVKLLDEYNITII